MTPMTMCHNLVRRELSSMLSAKQLSAGRGALHRHLCSLSQPAEKRKSEHSTRRIVSIHAMFHCQSSWSWSDNQSNAWSLSSNSVRNCDILTNPSKRKLLTRYGSTIGMSGTKIPSLGDVFSVQNKARVVTNLSKRTLRRFYTKDIRERGAVVVPLCSIDGEPCILFTLRTRTLKNHSGEVSFPGGKMDSTDRDVYYTALREMKEELGIDPGSVEIWGNLSPAGRKEMTVVPVIGYLGEIDVSKLDFNTDEVSAVFVMTLSHLCGCESQAYTTFEPHKPSGRPVATLPVFLGGEHRVWGLTAHILDQALQSIVPDHYQSLVARVKNVQQASYWRTLYMS